MNKMTPQIRFQGFTDDWEERKLGELASFSKGNGYTKNDLVEFGDPIILYGRLYTKYETVIEKVDTFVNKKDKSIISEGSEVIVPASGESSEDISRASVVGKSGIILGGDLNIIKPVNYIDSIFLALTISNGSQQKEMSKRAQGKSVVHLHNSDLKQVNILYPKLEEQQKIGSFFKQLDNTIALHQRMLDLLKEQKKGFLQKMFPKNGAKVPELRFSGFDDDWEERKLIDIAGNISDGDWIEANHIFDTGDYRIVQTGNIGIGSFLDKLQNAKYFYQADFDELKANEIFPGDILISRLSDPAGRTSILPDLGVRAVTAVDVAIIRPNDNFHAEFLVAELNSSTILAKVDSLASGSTRKRISRKNLEGVQITLPTFEEQQKIGSFFKQLDDTIALHQRKLDLLKEQKKGFLQKMFVS
ncbi:restriction endonuclease subunit S [Leuconostoc mesenteroides]|uniref:restriction endonuclease subunit S n=4 Tax=Leuconostoc mesenteroides TaxID=1245 RepID=UPI0023607B01|nr:restriction endonuclease subunit S [Leuconostoc mesenteroides]